MKNITLSKKMFSLLILQSSISVHLRSHSLPKSKSHKILVENTTIIAYEINKPWLQILEALHIKAQKPKIDRISFDKSDNVLKCL